jgi:DNA-directed RNA polymerase specialized sigma24 family protein
MARTTRRQSRHVDSRIRELWLENRTVEEIAALVDLPESSLKKRLPRIGLSTQRKEAR